MKALTLNEVATYLKEHNNYVILTHRRPDGDTTGSGAALCRGLRTLGKEAWVFENSQFTPKTFSYVDGLTVPEIPADATLISVDIATERLFPENGDWAERQVDLLLDHHGSNTAFAQMGYIDPGAAACGEIVLDLLILMGVEPNKEIAEAIYVAISTDTGCFRFSNTTANTLMAAATCKKWGADTFTINRTFFMTKRPARLKLEAHLANSTEFFGDGKVAITLLSQQIRRELGITQDDIDDISGFGREIEGVEIAAMIREEAEGGRISLRTSPNYDASSVCEQLGGGGHRAAAGATVVGGMEEAKEAVLRILTEMGMI